MGQKVNPIGFRTGVIKGKEPFSKWFAKKRNFGKLLIEDEKIRKFLEKKLKYASVVKIKIERAGSRLRITIFTARPAVIIGRKGQELDKLKEEVQQITKSEILLDIQEIKKPDLWAQYIAESVALQLERRISFRRAMKKAIETAMSLGALGVKIQCSGRLGGAEIARSEKSASGILPLHTLKANIDYGFKEAQTLHGLIGVKSWVCLNQEENR